MGRVIVSGAGRLSVPITKLTVSLTPKPGVTYTEGISDLTPDTLSTYAEAISNVTGISNDVTSVYLDEGAMHRKISVGDSIIVFGGSGSSLTYTYPFDIIGFNHDTLTNPSAYGSPTVTGKAGITLQSHEIFETLFGMNKSDSNEGGWKESYMRNTVMISTEGVWGYIPSAWLSVIKKVNKTSGTGGGTTSGIDTTSDGQFLLSQVEVFNSTSQSVAGEGAQYSYYKNGGSKIKNWRGNAENWWLRSPVKDNNYKFCVSYSDGSIFTVSASDKLGVAFAFCV